jgi:hypothetical protein
MLLIFMPPLSMPRFAAILPCRYFILSAAYARYFQPMTDRPPPLPPLPPPFHAATPPLPLMLMPGCPLAAAAGALLSVFR